MGDRGEGKERGKEGGREGKGGKGRRELSKGGEQGVREGRQKES
jgi:hypothetical protein